MCSTCVKTCVVGYSIHVFPCFFSHQHQLIIGNQMFWLPCSSPHQWYIASYNAHNNTQRNRKKQVFMQFKILVGNCYIHALPVSGETHAISRSYAWERFPCTRFRGWGWLLMCPGMPPAHILDAAVGWSQLLRPHPRQWCGHCWCMACSATAEAEELALLRACLCSLRRWDKVLLVCPTYRQWQQCYF